MSAEGIVIVGSGQAAAQAVGSLRAEGYEGPVRLVGDESVIPYRRPALSKGFLAGELTFDRIELKPAAFYEASRCELLLGTRVTEVDCEAGLVITADAKRIPFEQLLLATGGRARLLDVPGADLGGIHYVRHTVDVNRLRRELLAGSRLVVIGGGYVGLEVAAVARKLGADVTVLEAADRVMARTVHPVTSAFFERVHQERGVHLRTGTVVSGLEGHAGRVRRVVTADGEPFECDLVVVGIGLIPNTDLAAAAGIAE